jgi:hypothetical protein
MFPSSGFPFPARIACFEQMQTDEKPGNSVCHSVIEREERAFFVSISSQIGQ